MALRWAASAFLMTETNFRRIEGYRDLCMLKAALDPSAKKNQATSLDQVALNDVVLQASGAIAQPNHSCPFPVRGRSITSSVQSSQVLSFQRRAFSPPEHSDPGRIQFVCSAIDVAVSPSQTVSSRGSLKCVMLAALSVHSSGRNYSGTLRILLDRKPLRHHTDVSMTPHYRGLSNAKNA
jgi:hypothetical protein